MPYIEPERRKAMKKPMGDLMQQVGRPGDLTYVYYYLAKRYAANKGHGFTTFCTIIGVLVCTALEFYRRMVSPYEDTKIKEHGDVE